MKRFAVGACLAAVQLACGGSNNPYVGTWNTSLTRMGTCGYWNTIDTGQVQITAVGADLDFYLDLECTLKFVAGDGGIAELSPTGQQCMTTTVDNSGYLDVTITFTSGSLTVSGNTGTCTLNDTQVFTDPGTGDMSTCTEMLSIQMQK